MKRFPALAALAFALCAFPAAARADLPAPAAQASPTPAPAPAPAPNGRPRLFQQGRNTISVGVTLLDRSTSEFAPASAEGRTGLDFWQAGEMKILGIPVLTTADFRETAYPHAAADPVTVIGGAGTVAVAPFLVHDWTLENASTLRVAPHVFAGIALLNRLQNTGYPALHGLGYTVLLVPSAAPLVAPYGWISYYGNAGGNYTLADFQKTALTYRGVRYRGGVLLNERGTPFAFDVGFDGETLTNRTNAPATVRDFALRAGLAVRL